MELQDFFLFVLLLLGALAIYTMIKGSERYDESTTINLPVPENPYPNRKRSYTKRSNYWINPTKRRRKKYTKQSEYWTNGKALEKAKKARAAKLKEKTLN
jgi:hypothetical protein